jgi:predicted component of type VI protein secretion system
MYSSTRSGIFFTIFNLKVAQLLYDAWRAMRRMMNMEETTTSVPGG